MHEVFMKEAISLAREGMDRGEGGPFGCVIVRNGEVIGRGYNKVTSSNDPSAHAEVVAIRDACSFLNTFQLTGCDVYTSCEPCPMCLGAIYWARPDRVFYACTRDDAAHIGFDDDFIYNEIAIPIEARRISMVQLEQSEGIKVFEAWAAKSDRIDY